MRAFRTARPGGDAFYNPYSNPLRAKCSRALGGMGISICFIWWAHQDLNLEPTDYESAALTN